MIVPCHGMEWCAPAMPTSLLERLRPRDPNANFLKLLAALRKQSGGHVMRKE